MAHHLKYLFGQIYWDSCLQKLAHPFLSRINCFSNRLHLLRPLSSLLLSHEPLLAKMQHPLALLRLLSISWRRFLQHLLKLQLNHLLTQICLSLHYFLQWKFHFNTLNQDFEDLSEIQPKLNSNDFFLLVESWNVCLKKALHCSGSFLLHFLRNETQTIEHHFIRRWSLTFFRDTTSSFQLTISTQTSIALQHNVLLRKRNISFFCLLILTPSPALVCLSLHGQPTM